MELSDQELRTVFDAFDKDRRGYISTDRFLLLAGEYFGNENNKGIKSARLIEALDPSGSGLIDYNAFCEGVRTIHTETKGISSKERVLAPTSFSFSIEDLSLRTTSDDDTHSNGTSESTFNEYDDSVLTDMSEESSPSLLINDLLSTPTETTPRNNDNHYQAKMSADEEDTNHNHLNGDSSLSEISGHSSPLALQKDGEDQFEDFGENDIGIEIDVQDIPTALEATDQILNGHSPTNSPIKRVTSKECATELYRSTSSSNLPTGAADEAFGEYAASDSDIMELTDKVRDLESQVISLEKEKMATDELQLKLKSDNTYLMKQKDLFEEQMKELDQRMEESLKEKERKHSEAITKQEKEFQQELSASQNRISVLQVENEKLEHAVSQYKPKVAALTHQNTTLEAQLQEADGNWLSLSVELQQREDEYKQEKEEMEDVIHNSNTMIDDLSRQLETLQANHKTQLEEKDALMRSPSIADLPSRFTELKQEVQQLRKENQQLKETNEELNVQILNNSVTIGRSLLHKDAIRSSASFAAEMESSSRDEVVQALAEEKRITRDLRTYIGKILEKVIQKHPELLEIDVPASRAGSISSESSAKSS